MDVLFYAFEGVGDDIRRTVSGVIPGLEVYRTLGALTARFRQVLEQPAITVLVVRDRDELESLLTMRTALRDTRTVLVLPDRGAETISRGHYLEPRFMSYLDQGPEEVASVLRKMVNTHGIVR
mgnify:CR=1 FL=1